MRLPTTKGVDYKVAPISYGLSCLVSTAEAAMKQSAACESRGSRIQRGCAFGEETLGLTNKHASPYVAGYLDRNPT